MTTPLYFDAYTTAIETYPDDNVKLKIVDVTPAVGTSINEGEFAKFNVRVTNNGPVTLKDVKVKIEGLNGTQVGNTGGSLLFDSLTPSLNHDVQEDESKKFDLFQGTTGPFQLKAGAAAPKEGLIKVTLEDWTADLSPIYTNHTGERSQVNDTYSAEVFNQ